MEYRLLVSIEVVEFLECLSKSDRRALRNQFHEITAHPQKFSDYREYDANNRLLDIHILGKFAIKYWEDTADAHLKVLDVHFADRK